MKMASWTLFLPTTILYEKVERIYVIVNISLKIALINVVLSNILINVIINVIINVHFYQCTLTLIY